MLDPNNLLASYHSDVDHLLQALGTCHQTAVQKSRNIQSPVERGLRATAALTGLSLKSLASRRRPALIWFGLHALVALVITSGFGSKPSATLWADLAWPLMLTVFSLCAVPTLLLGWAQLPKVYALWYGKQSDRELAKARVDVFVTRNGGQQLTGVVEGTLVQSGRTQGGSIRAIEGLTGAAVAQGFVLVTLPTGELVHVLNTSTQVAHAPIDGIEYLKQHGRAYGLALADECRQAGIIDAMAQLVDVLEDARRGGKPEGRGFKAEERQPAAIEPTPIEPAGAAWDSLVLDNGLKSKLRVTVQALREAETLRLQGFEPPTSLLLYGPPGTGKTEVARTLASMSGMAFYSARGSDLKAGYIGQSAPRVRALFEAARANAPSFIFVDEFEVLAARRDAQAGDKDRLSDEIVAELLVELDGVVKSDQAVFFLAATNFPEQVDAALLNRFSDRREVPLPDYGQRLQMLAIFLTGKRCEESAYALLPAVAQATEGLSGRSLRNLVNIAAEAAIGRALASGQAHNVCLSATDLEVGAQSQGRDLGPEYSKDPA